MLHLTRKKRDVKSTLIVLNVCRRVLNDEHAAEDAMQAVFLVLARKAGSTAWNDSIAGWLHETAQRTALKARTARHRLEQRERQATPMSSTEINSDLHWRELRQVLDVELARLPDKYRAPLVLCYLEGKSNEEAARALGWTLGTVSGRLARAREMLRERMSRRGLALGAAVMSELISQHAAEAALAPALGESTVRAALLFAGSSPQAAEFAPAFSINLAEGVLHAMFVARIKMVAVLVLALGLLAGTGFVVGQKFASTPPVLATLAVVDPVPPRPVQKDIQSRPVVDNDAEFVLDTQSLWQAPAPGQTATIKLGLTITNRGKEARSFLPWPGEIILKTPAGEVIAAESRGQRGLRRRLAYEPLAPGKSLRVSEPPVLRSDGNSLSLEWDLATGERIGHLKLRPGKYLVAMRYSQQSAGQPVWGGLAETDPVAIEIVSAKLTQSKPIVKNGLAFQVETQESWQVLVPAVPERRADGQIIESRTSFPLALRVTNQGTEPCRFVPWRGQPVVQKLDGTLLPMKNHGRDGTRARPAIRGVEPGQSLVAAEAVSLTAEGTLHFHDMSGSYCTIDGLKPGKYLLSLKYDMPRGLADEWLGTVVTEPVTITIEVRQ